MFKKNKLKIMELERKCVELSEKLRVSESNLNDLMESKSTVIFTSESHLLNPIYDGAFERSQVKERLKEKLVYTVLMRSDMIKFIETEDCIKASIEIVRN